MCKRVAAKIRATAMAYLLLSFSGLGYAQDGTISAPSLPTAGVKTFDVISIRASKQQDLQMTRMKMIPNGFQAENTNLEQLMTNAYDLRTDKILGLPGWTSSEHYDVDAKVLAQDGNTFKQLSNEQRRDMSRQMLVERFGIKTHFEERDGDIFNLVLAKGGLKIKPLTQDRKSNISVSMSPSEVALEGDAMPMEALADAVSRFVHMDVKNMTGATGSFPVHLRWSSNDGPVDASNHDEALPSIYTALEETLGLKLVKSRGRVKYLVVDHVEKPELN